MEFEHKELHTYFNDFWAILAGLLWSTIGIWGKLAYRFGIHPLPLATLRAVVAAAIFFIAVLARKRFRIGKNKLKSVLLLSILGFVGVTVNYGTYLYAVRMLPVALAAILLYTYPLITGIISRIFLKEPLTSRKILALCIALCGILGILDALSLQLSVTKIWGIIFGIATALSVSIYNVLSKVVVEQHSPDIVMFFNFLFGSMMLAIFTSIIAPEAWLTVRLDWQLWLVILALAVLPTVGGYFAFLLAVKNIGAARASILATVEPIAAALLAYIIFGESLKPVQMCGAALILTGVILLLSSEE